MAYKVSIYLGDPELRRRLKLAAARRDTTISAFCEEAIREKLAREESDLLGAARAAAKRLDERRSRLGPVKISTADLVKEGRYR
ncbi:MAG: CopG family transcriptional regulator [Bacillota bacterium]